VLRYVSKLCWIVLTLYHLGHGGASTFGTPHFLSLLSGSDDQSYFGSRLDYEFMLFACRVVGVAQILLGLAAFALGDSKFCYTAQIVGLAAGSASQKPNVDLFKLSAKGTLTKTHAEGLDISVYASAAFLGVAVLGFLCTGAKNDAAVPRSKNLLVRAILFFTVALGAVSGAWQMLDAVQFFRVLGNGLDISKMPPTTLGSLSLLFSNGGGFGLSFHMIVYMLKPTRNAIVLCVLAALANLLIGVYTMHKLESTLETSVQLSQFINVCRVGGYISGCFLLLQSVAFALANTKSSALLEKKTQ